MISDTVGDDAAAAHSRERIPAGVRPDGVGSRERRAVGHRYRHGRQEGANR